MTGCNHGAYRFGVGMNIICIACGETVFPDVRSGGGPKEDPGGPTISEAQSGHAGTVRAAAGGAEAVGLVGGHLLGEIARLRQVVARQDAAIDVAMTLIDRLARKGSVTAAFRDFAGEQLILARNESMELGVTPGHVRSAYRAKLDSIVDRLSGNPLYQKRAYQEELGYRVGEHDKLF